MPIWKISDRPFPENQRAISHIKPYHPWTNCMVERMNRSIKESTIKAYEHEGLEQLREHVHAFVQSYSFGKHLKALRWKTPFRAMWEAWE